MLPLEIQLSIAMPFPSHDLNFQRHILWSVLVHELMWQVFFCYVDIGRVVDYHCLNIFFTILCVNVLENRLKIIDLKD